MSSRNKIYKTTSIMQNSYLKEYLQKAGCAVICNSSHAWIEAIREEAAMIPFPSLKFYIEQLNQRPLRIFFD